MYTGSLGSVSRREDWIETSPLIDDGGNETTLTAADFEMFVCRQGDPDSSVLTASITNGKITLPSTTTFQWHFTPDDMATLCAGTYDVFLRVTISGETTQIISGTVSIVEGGPA